jgi:hypothetical protein
MADLASQAFHLTNEKFLTQFNLSFPQALSWTLLPPHTETLSAISLALSCERPPPECFQRPSDDRRSLEHLGRIPCLAWTSYLTNSPRDSYLRYTPSHQERLHMLLLFVWRYRTGQISASGNPTKAGSVAEALRAVSTKFELDGYDDPRRRPGQPTNNLLLTSVMKAWSNEDPPPHRARPFPIQLHLRSSTRTEPMKKISHACRTKRDPPTTPSYHHCIAIGGVSSYELEIFNESAEVFAS